MPLIRRGYNPEALRDRLHRVRSENAARKGLPGPQANYDMAAPSRIIRERRGWSPLGTGADYHTRFPLEYWRTLELASELDRNSFAGTLLDRAATNIVQDGLRVQPATGDKVLDADLLAFWDAWRHDPQLCDVQERHTFAELQYLVARSMLGQGDIFALLSEDGPIQLAEAFRCRRPQDMGESEKRYCVHGVTLDAQRRAVEYWFTKDELNPWRTVALLKDMQRIAARDPDGALRVAHVLDPRRISQTRGVTAFANVFAKFSIYDDLQMAKLVQAIAVSCFTLVHNVPPKPSGGADAASAAARGQQMQVELSDGRFQISEDITPGQEIWSAPGETVSILNGNVPNETYLPFALAVLKEICAGLDVPLFSYLLDGSQTNFSGFRGAQNEAQKGWRRRQRILRDKFVRPSYANALRAAARADATFGRALQRLGRRFFGNTVNLPAWAYIQPEVEAAADADQIDRGLTSPTRIMARKSGDYPEMVAERAKDFALRIRSAIETAAELKAETGLDIDPRQILNIDPDRPLLLEASPNPPAPSGAAVNAQLVTDALTRVARGELNADAGAALLTAAGVAAELAPQIVAGVNVTPAPADADTVEFLRKVFLAFQADGTVADILANATALKTLTQLVGLPVEPSYQDPWIPVRDDNGKLVGGETIKDPQGDVIGAEPLEEEGSGFGVRGSAKDGENDSTAAADEDAPDSDAANTDRSSADAEPRTANQNALAGETPTPPGETPAQPGATPAPPMLNPEPRTLNPDSEGT